MLGIFFVIQQGDNNQWSDLTDKMAKVKDPSQQKVIQAELLELIERRKETISKSRINSEGEKSNKVEREPKIGAEVKPEGPEVKPEGPEVKPKGPEVKPEPKLNHAGTDQQPTGSKFNSGVDQKSYKEEVNLSLQIEKLATMTTQDKFLNGARINDSDGVIIRLEKAVIDDPDFYATWGWINMKAICLSLIIECSYCSKMPVTNRQPDDPEDYLAKMMIGRSFRLVANYSK